MIGAVLQHLVRTEHARVMATLVRALRSVDLAEEALQDAYERAFERWPVEGIPDRPAAWLTTVAKRRALDLAKARQRRDRRAMPLEAALGQLVVEPLSDDDAEASTEEESKVDDRLRLVFVCCHPALAPRAQVSLALRLVCGLSTREIGRALLEDDTTTGQRIVRAKQKIEAARIPFAIPRETELGARVASALAVVYLVFTEGHAAAEHERLVRTDLCEEALRLARLLVELLPERGDARALLALLLLTHARTPARLDERGDLVLLEDQDRSVWDRARIEEGRAELARAIALGARGSYAIEAAIADVHSHAARAADTDWPQICGLYGALLRERPEPLVVLNAAVALFLGGEPERALGWIEELDRDGALAGYALFHAAYADLLRRLGRGAEARPRYARALELARSPAERRFLERRLAQT